MSIKVLELFSGIRATSEALTRLGINHETTTVEYDKKVQDVANTLWGTNDPVRDVTKFTPEQKYDLVVAGFPCQPFSMAGKGQGFDDEKGRGKLYQDTLRIIKQADPDYVILENVKALTYQKHKWIIDEIENTLLELGYKVNVQIINAKDYLPQNRERLFIIASKIKQPGNIEHAVSDLKLKDFLEKDNEYSEKEYYDAEKLEKISNWNSQEKPLTKIAHENTKNVKTITTRTQPGTASQQLISENIVKEFTNFVIHRRASDGKLENGAYNRMWKDDMFIGTITTLGQTKIINWNELNTFNLNDNENFKALELLKIRSLTPRESWRLMGWTDDKIDRVINLPKSKLYFTAGNSMVIPVMEAIIKELILNKEEN